MNKINRICTIQGHEYNISLHYLTLIKQQDGVALNV